MRSCVEATVEPGFERVRIEFEKNLAERGEIGAAFSVYHRDHQRELRDRIVKRGGA